MTARACQWCRWSRWTRGRLMCGAYPDRIACYPCGKYEREAVADDDRV